MLNAAWFTIGMKKRGTESHLRLLWLPFTIRTKKIRPRRSDIGMVQRTTEQKESISGSYHSYERKPRKRDSQTYKGAENIQSKIQRSVHDVWQVSLLWKLCMSKISERSNQGETRGAAMRLLNPCAYSLEFKGSTYLGRAYHVYSLSTTRWAHYKEILSWSILLAILLSKSIHSTIPMGGTKWEESCSCRIHLFTFLFVRQLDMLI